MLDSMSTFVSVFADLDDTQKKILEGFTRMDFATIEQRLISHMIRPLGKSRAGELANLVIGCDWADGPDHVAMTAMQRCGDVYFIIDDLATMKEIDHQCIYDVLQITPAQLEQRIRQTPFRGDALLGDNVMDIKVGFVDDFRFIMPPKEESFEDQAKYAPKTQGQKKPLPYYQGKRRF
jgi:hypothetical protein